jgi:hypothetical protein
VGRHYAGILGPLAFFTIAVRGLMQGAGVQSTLLWAAIQLFLFAFIGYVVGQLADWVVFESVRDKVAAEIEAHQSKPPAATHKG